MESVGQEVRKGRLELMDMEGKAAVPRWEFFREPSVPLFRTFNGSNQAHPDYLGSSPILKVN